MGILLSLAPFLLFAVIERVLGPTQGLIAGTLAAAALVARDLLTPGRSPKILEIGTVVLFGALALYALVGSYRWSVIGVRLCVDAGLLAIVLVSMAVGRPFTLQYAHERVPAEHQNSAAFLRTNYVVTGTWAVAFAIMVAVETALCFMPNFPQRLGIWVIIAALFGALKFTRWYPGHVRGRAVA